MIKHLLLVLLLPAAAFGASTTNGAGRVIQLNTLSEIDVAAMILEFRKFRGVALRAGDFELAAIWSRRIATQVARLHQMRQAAEVNRKVVYDLQIAASKPPRKP